MRLTPAMAAISLMRVFRGALSDFFTMAETPLSNFNSFYKIPRPAKKSSFISPENNFSCQGILRQATLQRPWCRRVASAAFQLRKSAVHSRKSPAGDAMHCSGCSRTFGARPAAPAPLALVRLRRKRRRGKEREAPRIQFHRGRKPAASRQTESAASQSFAGGITLKENFR